LFEALNLLAQQLSAIGFVEDINLLAYSESTAENCIALETAHNQCLQWASTHGMRFALDKYTLTPHFTRRHNFDLTAAVQLGERTIKPFPNVRILGLLLDSRLR
jgi:hypothetical protein